MCFCSGPVVLSNVLLELVRAFYSYCREMLGEEAINSSGLSGNQLARWEFDYELKMIYKIVNCFTKLTISSLFIL